MPQIHEHCIGSDLFNILISDTYNLVFVALQAVAAAVDLVVLHVRFSVGVGDLVHVRFCRRVGACVSTVSRVKLGLTAPGDFPR